MTVFAVTGTVLREAAGLVARRPLRAYDAVQLPCALNLRRVEPSCTGFVTFDAGLGTAAAAESFTLVPGT